MEYLKFWDNDILLYLGFNCNDDLYSLLYPSKLT